MKTRRTYSFRPRAPSRCHRSNGAARRDVDQAGVVALALDAVVRPGQRLARVVRQVTVELDVFLVLDLGLGTRPERRAAVDGLVFERRRALLRHAHREGDVIRIAAHQRTQAPGIEELLRVLLEVQHDGGAALARARSSRR